VVYFTAATGLTITPGTEAGVAGTQTQIGVALTTTSRLQRPIDWTLKAVRQAAFNTAGTGADPKTDQCRSRFVQRRQQHRHRQVHTPHFGTKRLVRSMFATPSLAGWRQRRQLHDDTGRRHRLADAQGRHRRHEQRRQTAATRDQRSADGGQRRNITLDSGAKKLCTSLKLTDVKLGRDNQRKH